MEFIGNHANGAFLEPIVRRITRSGSCEGVDAAVAYVTNCDLLFDLCTALKIPFHLRCLCNHEAQPSSPIVDRFLNGPGDWDLSLTQGYFHAKVIWFRGAGAYIGSANLTQNAWWHNCEAGLFLDEQELLNQGLDQEIQTLLDHVDGRSRAAVHSDLDAIRKLRSDLRDRDLDVEERRRKLFEDHFERVPGKRSVGRPQRKLERKRTARRDNFIQEWTSTLSLLQKLQRSLDEDRKPRPWVPADTPLSVEVDQILTWYYEERITRHEGGAAAVAATFHASNQGDGDANFRDVLTGWQTTTEMVGFIRDSLRDWAPELRGRLQPGELRKLDADGLYEILRRSHAIRLHGYRVRNDVLGLPGDTHLEGEERLRLFAKWLWERETTKEKRTIQAVLSYVLWDDREPAARRLWKAAKDPASGWMIPRFKVSSLGELLGWARPDEFPPRNNRVSRALHALGYGGVARYGDG